jgi:hypothetical protein
VKAMNRRVNHYVATGLMLLASAGCNAIFGFDERPLFVESGDDVCIEYCEGILAECLGSSEQYENLGACEESCFAMNSGAPGATSGDNVECRLRHVEEAALLRAEEKDTFDVCSQAGYASAIFDDPPAPACATPCKRYCERLSAICTEAFANAGFDDENCVGECAKVAIDPNWNPAGPDRDRFDSLQCRLWHLSNAEENPGTHCNHAVGVGKCALPLE